MRTRTGLSFCARTDHDVIVLLAGGTHHKDTHMGFLKIRALFVCAMANEIPLPTKTIRFRVNPDGRGTKPQTYMMWTNLLTHLIHNRSEMEAEDLAQFECMISSRA